MLDIGKVNGDWLAGGSEVLGDATNRDDERILDNILLDAEECLELPW